MSNSVQIVPFTTPYRDQVIELILHIQQAEFGVAITAADQPDLAEIPNFYQQRDGNFWIALDGSDHVVGTIALLDIGNHQVALRKMFVNDAWRGKDKGVAQRLLDTLLAWARDHNVRTILLGTTSKYLAAHRFYEKNGFEEVARETLPEAFPIMAVDSKFYRRQL